MSINIEKHTIRWQQVVWQAASNLPIITPVRIKKIPLSQKKASVTENNGSSLVVNVPDEEASGYCAHVRGDIEIGAWWVVSVNRLVNGSI